MNQKYLQNLLGACGASGYESNVQQVFTKQIKKYSDEIYKDPLGNIIAVQNPESDYRIMITAHADEIGFIVTYISDEGYIYFDAIGGIDKKVVPGSHVLINGTIPGIVGKKAIHVDDERNKAEKLEDLFIDIGAKNKKECSKIVKIGDTATFTPNYLELRNGLFASKACDNRVGLYVISEVFRLVKGKTPFGIYAVSATQEEVGYRGAIVASYNVNPDVGIAVDVTHTSDIPAIDKKENGDIKMGKGGVIGLSPSSTPKLVELIKSTAKKKKIKYQVQASGSPYGTDTNVMQTTQEGVATTLISIPNRYMHTQVEVCCKKDLDSTAKLIGETILAITPDEIFQNEIPSWG